MALPAQLDPTSPAGTDQVSLGDDNIRAFKQFLIDFLGIPSAVNCTLAAFSMSTAGGVQVAQGMSVALGKKITLAQNPADALEAATKQYVDGVSPIPSGTKSLFQQTAAPIGWTKDVVHNDKALRVVTGTASSGGSSSFSSTFAVHGEDGYVQAHTLTVAEMAAHAHLIPNFAASGSEPGYGGVGTSAYNTSTDTQGGNTGHKHGLAIAVQYVDVIIATKD